MPGPYAMTDDNCVCDHVLDEHDEDQQCTIDGCDCIHFEREG